jgi:hypothetical protein
VIGNIRSKPRICASQASSDAYSTYSSNTSQLLYYPGCARMLFGITQAYTDEMLCFLWGLLARSLHQCAMPPVYSKAARAEIATTAGESVLRDLVMRQAVDAQKDAATLLGTKRQKRDGESRDRRSNRSDASESASARGGDRTVAACPDGRKCKTCTYHDNDDDPVAKRFCEKLSQVWKDVFEYCWWGHPQDKNGKTMGSYCGYCVKIFNARIKHRKLTMVAWEAELGANEEGLKKHIALVDVCIQKLVENGGKRSFRLNWEGVEKELLQLLHQRRMTVKRPGYTFWKDSEYPFGDLETNGKKQEGHFRGNFEGAIGIYAPDQAGVKICFEDDHIAQIAKNVDDGSFNLSADQMETKAAEISAGFFNGDAANPLAGLGFDGRSGSSSLIPALPAASSAPTSTASGGAKAAPESAHTPDPSQIQQAGASTPRQSSRGQGQVQKEACNSSAASAKVSAKKRGRPVKNLGREVDELASRWMDASPTDVLFYGVEVKTQMKAVRDLLKELQQRIAKATQQEEAKSYEMSRKKIACILAFMELQDRGEFETPKFHELYDLQFTTLSLAPVAELSFPRHLLWKRAAWDIKQTANADQWLLKVSAASLEKHHGVNAAMEQANLLGQRILAMMKKSTFEETLGEIKDMFTLERDFPFHHELTDFSTALAVCVHFTEISDIDERLELVAESIAVVAAAERSSCAACAGFLGHPRGRKVYDDAAEHVRMLNLTKEKLTIVKEKEDIVIAHEAFCASSFLACEHRALQGFLAFLGEMANALQDMKEKGAEEFCTSVDAAARARVFSKVAHSAHTDWTTILIGLCTSDLNKDKLSSSISNAEAKQKRMHLVMDTLKTTCAGLLASDEHYQSAVKCHEFYTWCLEISKAYAENQFDDKDWCLKQLGRLADLPQVASQRNFGDAAQKCLDAPLFAKDGDLATKLTTGAFKDATALSTKLVESFRSIFGPRFGTMPLTQIAVSAMDLGALDDLQKWTIESSLFADLSKWAHDAGDQDFLTQVTLFSHVHRVATNLAKCTHLAKTIFQEGVLNSDKCITKERCQLLQLLRSDVDAMKLHVASPSDEKKVHTYYGPSTNSGRQWAQDGPKMGPIWAPLGHIDAMSPRIRGGAVRLCTCTSRPWLDTSMRRPSAPTWHSKWERCFPPFRTLGPRIYASRLMP